MIVPEFWAEARAQFRSRKQQITVRRFGWSDKDQAAAQCHANQRAEEALRAIRNGEELPRQERRMAYNGADGVPIREEIIARHEQGVIETRNGYGARCLNVADVLFVDVDFRTDASTLLRFVALVPFIALALELWQGLQAGLAAVILGLAGFLLAGPLANGLNRLVVCWRGGDEKLALGRIGRFLKTHPEWRFRVYRTPAGLRLLAGHRHFAPDESEVLRCFSELGADPVYVRMCRRQRCFRARVSAKPWRAGMAAHIRPSSWPVRDAALAGRTAWIQRYESAAESYAACRFVAEMGDGQTDPEIEAVIATHDRLSRADSALPLA